MTHETSPAYGPPSSSPADNPAANRRREAAELLSQLLASGAAASDVAMVQLSGLRGLQRLRALLEASRGIRDEDPQAMVEFARLARCAADRLRVRDYGTRQVADLRALAWGELGNAYRNVSDPRRATDAMQRAVHWCHRGTGSEPLLARIADLIGSLLGTQNRWEPGRDLLHLAERYQSATGNNRFAARALMKLAGFSSWEGHFEDSLLLQKRAFDLLDPEADADFIHLQIWNMITNLVALGRFRVARRLIWRTRTLYEGVFEPHRVRWIEGKIFAGLGENDRAEAAFLQARQAFVERGKVTEAASIGLELATLWARQGRIDEVYALCEELVATFRALGISREAVAALLVLRKASLVGGQLVDGIEMAMGFLRETERRSRAGSLPPAAE